MIRLRRISAFLPPASWGVNGRGELLNMRIEREVVDPDDVEMLVDLIVAAVQEAQKNAQEIAKEKLGPLTQGMNIPGMPGL